MTKRKACVPPAFAQLEGVDDLSLDVFRSFMRAMHLQRQLVMRSLTGKGSHMGQIGCLKLLAANDGISQRDLAEMLHLSRPSVTAIVQALEKAGAVERRSDERDQRLTRVYLTGEGRAEELRQRQVLSEFVNRTVGRMPEADRRELARLLNSMNDHSVEALSGHATEEGATEPR